MVFDYHTHSTYSDGSFLDWMVRAAKEAGLEGIGFADHCNVSTREIEQRKKQKSGFNLDKTYKRRRNAIEHINSKEDIIIFDAVEMDYDPADEEEIREFLKKAGFDYSVGSVHRIDGHSVMSPGPFRDMTRSEKQQFLEKYVEHLVKLVSSELFDIAAHIDVVERNPQLRGLLTEKQYERIVDAFCNTDTVPEINAGRVFGEYGKIHPHPDLFERLADEDTKFTLGSDAHTPEQLLERAEFLKAFFTNQGIEPFNITY